MKKKLILIMTVMATMGLHPLSAKEYLASLFGIRSDGTTLNTNSIQKAIDYIHEQGGGTLVFNVGRYLTGSLELKSNVSVHLKEGAVLLGATNPYDYNINGPHYSLIRAVDQKNISITGKGIIDGQGRELAYNVIDQVHRGVLKDRLEYDRPRRPRGISMKGCDQVEISGITIKNTADWVQSYDQCTNLKVDGITVDSKAYWNNDGIDIVDCKDVSITNSFFDVSDDAICLKSHSADHLCENIEIRNCVARSSANGIKMGTVTRGGYKNIRIINNKVYDTYRSAITITVPDGGKAENILVDSLQAYHTGNALFIRIGARSDTGRTGTIDNITISNLYVEIPEGKPDAGYDYEGPVEDLPRNISPASIMGLKEHDITNVTLKNIVISHPGGGDPQVARCGLTAEELDAIPELADKYPEFSRHKELPAWGFYIRHVKGLNCKDITLIARKRDYRPAIVMDNVHQVSLSEMNYREPGKKKKQVYTHNASSLK